MMDKEWIKQQLIFANSLGDMLFKANIGWSNELNFDSLYDYYPDEFEDMDDDELN